MKKEIIFIVMLTSAFGSNPRAQSRHAPNRALSAEVPRRSVECISRLSSALVGVDGGVVMLDLSPARCRIWVTDDYGARGGVVIEEQPDGGIVTRKEK
jgi:hypothetical protein